MERVSRIVGAKYRDAIKELTRLAELLSKCGEERLIRESSSVSHPQFLFCKLNYTAVAILVSTRANERAP
jgi:hypothetical protein